MSSQRSLDANALQLFSKFFEPFYNFFARPRVQTVKKKNIRGVKKVIKKHTHTNKLKRCQSQILVDKENIPNRLKPSQSEGSVAPNYTNFQNMNAPEHNHHQQPHHPNTPYGFLSYQPFAYVPPPYHPYMCYGCISRDQKNVNFDSCSSCQDSSFNNSHPRMIEDVTDTSKDERLKQLEREIEYLKDALKIVNSVAFNSVSSERRDLLVNQLTPLVQNKIDENSDRLSLHFTEDDQLIDDNDNNNDDINNYTDETNNNQDNNIIQSISESSLINRVTGGDTDIESDVDETNEYEPIQNNSLWEDKKINTNSDLLWNAPKVENELFSVNVNDKKSDFHENSKENIKNNSQLPIPAPPPINPKNTLQRASTSELIASFSVKNLKRVEKSPGGNPLRRSQSSHHFLAETLSKKFKNVLPNSPTASPRADWDEFDWE